MRKLLLISVLLIASPLIANAGGTSIQYYKYVGGGTTQKMYYIKESVKKADPKNPDIVQVNIYGTVEYQGNTGKHKSTIQINCKTKEKTTTKHWSSEYGDDKGTVVDGKWISLESYYGGMKLAEQICPR